jgi:hypothetical protein
MCPSLRYVDLRDGTDTGLAPTPAGLAQRK